jgi:hypothetical protein
VGVTLRVLNASSRGNAREKVVAWVIRALGSVPGEGENPREGRISVLGPGQLPDKYAFHPVPPEVKRGGEVVTVELLLSGAARVRAPAPGWLVGVLTAASDAEVQFLEASEGGVVF